MLIVRLSLILMVITTIAAGSLALLNQKTAPIIAENKARQQEIARREVVQSIGGTRFEYVNNEELPFYKAFDDEGNLVGYVALAKGKGYSSTIETVCGFDTNWHVSGLKITFQQETPGLGTKSQEIKKGERKPWFQRQFEDKDALKIAVRQDRGQIDSITGATITSRAVTNSVRAVAETIRELTQMNIEP